MEKQDIGSPSRADAVSKTAGGHPGQVSEGPADFDRNDSMAKRLVLAMLMAFPATLVAIILKAFHLGAFWHHLFLAISLVFTILTFVAVYLPTRKIDGH